MTANGGSLRLGDPMPNFVCDSTEGRMSLHQALGAFMALRREVYYTLFLTNLPSLS